MVCMGHGNRVLIRPPGLLTPLTHQQGQPQKLYSGYNFLQSTLLTMWDPSPTSAVTLTTTGPEESLVRVLLSPVFSGWYWYCLPVLAMDIFTKIEWAVCGLAKPTMVLFSHPMQSLPALCGPPAPSPEVPGEKNSERQHHFSPCWVVRVPKGWWM